MEPLNLTLTRSGKAEKGLPQWGNLPPNEWDDYFHEPHSFSKRYGPEAEEPSPCFQDVFFSKKLFENSN